jgi:hypothetical protein
MVTRGFRQSGEVFTLKIHTIEVSVIGPSWVAVGGEVNPALFFVHGHNLHDGKVPFGEPPNQGSV